MGKQIQHDCSKCQTRFSWDISHTDELCPRCIIMGGSDITAILLELRKSKVPGQEPIFHLIEKLNEKMGLLERLLNGIVDVKKGATIGG